MIFLTGFFVTSVQANDDEQPGCKNQIEGTIAALQHNIKQALAPS
jgi:hypothetical protein